MTEPNERATFRRKCRHFSYGQCGARSGWLGNGIHINMACTGDCERMRNYDAQNGINEHYEVTE